MSSQDEKTRKPTYEINSLILNRWSPRSLTGQELDDKELYSLFEAARWAPSSYNNQPWRFIYAKRSSSHWNLLFSLLADGNKSWCANASVLVVIVSKKTFDYNGKPSITHKFDAGAAWENLALQAITQGLVTHAMQGFDYDRAKKELDVPDDYEVTAMVAIGKRAPKEKLPPELQKNEFPNDRKPLSEIVMEGKFGNKVKLP